MKVHFKIDNEKPVVLESRWISYKQLCNTKRVSPRRSGVCNYVKGYFKNIYNPLGARMEFQTTPVP